MEDAEIIRNWRANHGYTQPVAAKVLRTSVPTVTLRKYQRYETGETRLPIAVRKIVENSKKP
jgi:hypothetical protein